MAARISQPRPPLSLSAQNTRHKGAVIRAASLLGWAVGVSSERTDQKVA